MGESDSGLKGEDFVVRFGRRVRRCKVMSKRTGERCNHPAVKGYDVCRMHGANPKNKGGGQPGNLHGLKHGAYVKRLLNDEDRELFNSTIEAIHQDFDLNKSTDQMQAVMAAFYFTRWFRAIEGKADAAIGNFDVLFRKQLECLKTTRAQRDTNTGLTTTPAEWAVALLARVREAKEKDDDGDKTQ